jgi:hypothetical protein
MSSYRWSVAPYSQHRPRDVRPGSQMADLDLTRERPGHPRSGDGHPRTEGLRPRWIDPSQRPRNSIRYTEKCLGEAGIVNSVGFRGYSYDCADPQAVVRPLEGSRRLSIRVACPCCDRPRVLALTCRSPVMAMICTHRPDGGDLIRA